jgi:hypothetical protein
LYDHCLQNQGELFEAAAGWLREILADLGADFNVRFEARPCQKTDKRLPLKHAADILAGVSGEVKQTANAEVRVENKAGHKVR